jgi:hypothetical protein
MSDVPAAYVPPLLEKMLYGVLVDALIVNGIEVLRTDVFCSLHATELETTLDTPSDTVHLIVPLFVLAAFTVD